MLTTGLFSWFTSQQGLMNLLTQNWLIGVLGVAVIIFCETGLVVMPFLPGDSILFATGAFLGMSGIAPLGPVAILILAAVLGDGVNFLIGRSSLGQQLIVRGWIKPKHLNMTKTYFERYGAPTVSMGRFVPVVRTIAPFLAGLSGMCPKRFALYNATGAVLWCTGLVMAGYWLGGMVWVREHISALSLVIVALSVLPVLLHLARSWQPRKTDGYIAAGRRSDD